MKTTLSKLDRLKAKRQELDNKLWEADEEVDQQITTLKLQESNN